MVKFIEEGILEAKTERYAKVFVIILQPFLVIFLTTTFFSFTKLKFSFEKDIKVVLKKMTRNRRKMIRNTEDSLLCPLHSVQFLPLVFIPLCLPMISKWILPYILRELMFYQLPLV